MPNRRRNTRSKRPKNKAMSTQSKKLDTLIELERTQIHASVPTVRDVNHLLLKRNKVHTFTRTFAGPGITSPTVTDLLGALNFTLSALPSSTDFTSLFDQYRIAQVSIKFFPVAGVGTGSNPLVTVIDYDDSNTPSSVSDLYQYDSLQMNQPGTVFTRTLVPKTSTAVYSGAFTSFASAPNSLWIDVASPNVQYYGLKYGITAVTGATANWSTLIEYIVQLRNVR